MTDLVLMALPLLLLAAAGLLLLPAPLLAEHRTRAGMVALALVLGSLLLHAVMRQDTAFSCFIALLGGMAVAAPLLERARFYGLTTAALATGLAIPSLLVLLAGWMPSTLSLSSLLVALIIAVITGLAGSMKLPLQPRRHAATGAAIWHGAPQGIMLIGWVALALALAGVSYLLDGAAIGLSQVAGSLTAALAALLYSQLQHGEDGWQKAGEGLVAGLLITLLAPFSAPAGAILGLLAGFFVVRSEAIAHAIRVEDAHHFTGALLFPAMLGLIAPGFVQLSLLAAQLQWLGAAIGVALGMSLLLWPLAMFLLGIALPPRLMREGVR